MRSWGHFVGLLGPKFPKIMRKEGLMRAILRGKPNKMHPHEKAGWDEAVRCVGIDEVGNRYYEDFTHHNFNTRRFVEYADVSFSLAPNSKRVSPAWHGWLHYTYDDPPRKENFVDPFYKKSFIYETDHPTKSFLNKGHLLHPDRHEFKKKRTERIYKKWEPEESIKEEKAEDEILMNM